jgi:hypothetical protein
MPYKNQALQVACVKRWRLKNKEKYKISATRSNKRQYAKNRAARIKRTMEWQRANPEKVKLNKKRYRENRKIKRQMEKQAAEKLLNSLVGHDFTYEEQLVTLESFIINDKQQRVTLFTSGPIIRLQLKDLGKPVTAFLRPGPTFNQPAQQPEDRITERNLDTIPEEPNETFTYREVDPFEPAEQVILLDEWEKPAPKVKKAAATKPEPVKNKAVAQPQKTEKPKPQPVEEQDLDLTFFGFEKNRRTPCLVFTTTGVRLNKTAAELLDIKHGSGLVMAQNKNAKKQWFIGKDEGSPMKIVHEAKMLAVNNKMLIQELRKSFGVELADNLKLELEEKPIKCQGRWLHPLKVLKTA